MTTALQTILDWLKKNPFVFSHRLDGDEITLIESYSQKQIMLDTNRITQFRRKDNPQGFGEYLNLVFDDGLEIVLCQAGLAFSPNFASTGPLADAPPVTCLSDYHLLLTTLNVLSADKTRRGEAIALFQVLISILDGAKRIGLDVGVEEEALDRLLTTFELR